MSDFLAGLTDDRVYKFEKQDREKKYQSVIESLAEKFQILNRVQSDLKEINDNLLNKNYIKEQNLKALSAELICSDRESFWIVEKEIVAEKIKKYGCQVCKFKMKDSLLSRICKFQK